MLFWVFLTLFGTGTFVIFEQHVIWGAAMIVAGVIGMVGCAWPHLRDPVSGRFQLTWSRLRTIKNIKTIGILIAIALLTSAGVGIYRHFHPAMKTATLPQQKPAAPSSEPMNPPQPPSSPTKRPVVKKPLGGGNHTSRPKSSEPVAEPSAPQPGEAAHPTPAPTTPAPELAHIRIASQEQIVSTNPELPFGLHVVIQTDQPISPVSFLFTFTGDVGEGNAEFNGIFTQSVNTIVPYAPNQFFAEWQSPPFTADAPIIVTIFSKIYIKMSLFERRQYVFPITDNRVPPPYQH